MTLMLNPEHPSDASDLWSGVVTRALKHKREREQTKTLEDLRNKYV